MTLRVIPGAAINLGGNVIDSTTFLPKTSGTIFAIVQLNQVGDADDLKFWDINDDTWQTAVNVVTWPTATYAHGTWWTYLVAVAATTGRSGAIVKLVDLTDDEATPASVTVLAGGMESVIVEPTIEDQVWDALLANHVVASSFGANAKLVADQVWDALEANHVVSGSFGANLTAGTTVNVYESLEDDG